MPLTFRPRWLFAVLLTTVTFPALATGQDAAEPVTISFPGYLQRGHLCRAGRSDRRAGGDVDQRGRVDRVRGLAR